MGLTDKMEVMLTAFREFRDNKNAILADILSQRTDELLDRQRDQLASGLNSEGTDIVPPYSEDLKPGGYFHSSSAAERYAQWKQTINVPVYYKQTQRNPDTPNLYVNGRFHSELTVDITDEVLFHGGTSYAENIVDKFGLMQFGLNEQSWRDFMENGVITEILGGLRTSLGI